MKEKKLLRKMDSRMVCGVCAGVADYFDIDPTVVRVIWAGISLFAGAGVLLYIASAFIMLEVGSDGTIQGNDDTVQ